MFIAPHLGRVWWPAQRRAVGVSADSESTSFYIIIISTNNMSKQRTMEKLTLMLPRNNQSSIQSGMESPMSPISMLDSEDIKEPGLGYQRTLVSIFLSRSVAVYVCLWYNHTQDKPHSILRLQRRFLNGREGVIYMWTRVCAYLHGLC